MEIFIYRPDKGFRKNIDLDNLYNINGISFERTKKLQNSLEEAIINKYFNNKFYSRKKNHQIEVGN